MRYFIVIIYSQSHFIKIPLNYRNFIFFWTKISPQNALNTVLIWDWISKIFREGGVRRSQPRSEFFLDPRLVCPKGYYFYHIPRKNSRGGGVGVLLKENIRMKTQPQRKFTSFEYIDVIVNCSNSSTRMVINYRPPPSKKNQLNNTLFLEEFSKLMEQLIIVPGNLLIVGDFNYHVDSTTNPETIKFNKILEMFNLQQHVGNSQEGTHPRFDNDKDW